MPGNIHIKGVEIPIGLGLISLVLFSTAIVNLFTKELATIAGVTFSLVFFLVLTISERKTAHQHAAGESGLEQFNIAADRELSAQAMEVRPGNILVAVRDPRNLYYLRQVLAKTDTTKTDVVVMTSRVQHREHSFSGSEEMETSDVFRKYEQELFTSVVAAAEKEGRHVSLLVVPTNDVFESIVATAQRLHSSVVVCGLSNKLSADEQGKLTGDAWERLPEPRPRLRLVVVEPNGNKHEYMLGPHTPGMRQEDVDLLHSLWKEVTSDPRYRELHHYHVLNVALQEMAERMHNGAYRDEVMKEIHDEMERRGGAPLADDETTPAIHVTSNCDRCGDCSPLPGWIQWCLKSQAVACHSRAQLGRSSVQCLCICGLLLPDYRQHKSQIQPSGKGSATFTLNGTVVNSVTGEPVGRALVRVLGPVQRTAFTDQEGHFQIEGVQEGSPLGAQKPGYFSPMALDGGGSNRVGIVGPDAGPVTLKLTPQSVISGRVTDIAGDPIERLPVRLTERSVREGRQRWDSLGFAESDEDGRFRFANLMPGTYYLAVGPGGREVRLLATRWEAQEQAIQ